MKCICFDIGHMNTTGAFPTALPEGGYKVERLAFEDKELVLNSQLILTDEQMRMLKGNSRLSYGFLKTLGPIQIGNKLPAYIKDGEKFSYFKVAPKDFDKPYVTGECAKDVTGECAKASGITHGQLMACYVYALMEAVFQYNSDNWHESERGEIELLIGCPSTQDWVARLAQRQYAQLVQRATKVKSVRIVPESRGAMFSGVEKNKATFSAMNGAAVFDFGSSTADFTYMLMGRKVIEFSWTLGAGKIEEQMTMEACRELIRQQGNFVADEGSISAAIDLMRPAKEAYYDGIYGSEGQTLVCKFKEYNGVGKSKKVVIDVDGEFMDQIIEENEISVLCDSKIQVNGSWHDLCRRFYETAKKEIESAEYTGLDTKGNSVRKHCEVHSIILTGGASRMPFIATLARDVFDDPDTKIYLEKNPSHTVSNGLAWVAVSDERLGDCKKAALEKINANETCNVESLRTRVSDAIFDVVKETVIAETNAWAQSPGDTLTVEMLQKSLENKLGSDTSTKKLREVCAQEIEAWKDLLSSEMEAAVNAQTSALFTGDLANGVAIPRDVWKELQGGTLAVENLDVSDALTDLDMSSFIRKLVNAALQGVIIAAAVATALAGGLLFVPVEIIAAILAGEALKDKDLKKPRKKKIRQKVAKDMPKTITNQKNAVMKKFNDSFNEQTGAYQEMIDKTLTAAFEVATLRRFEL